MMVKDPPSSKNQGAFMVQAGSNVSRIPEALADDSTKRRLEKARKQTRKRIAKKLKVKPQTVRRYERQTLVYLAALRHYAEQRGGTLRFEVSFDDEMPVMLDLPDRKSK
jgi:hypothetical protein